MKTPQDLKVALVCDWLTSIGGAERVVLELHRLFPDAPIYTSQYDPVAMPWFADAVIHTSKLQKIPKSLKKFLPVLRAWSFSRLDLSEYDLVISSSGAEAKSIHFKEPTKHICYCHAPTHYYWSRYEAYKQNPGFPKGFNWLARLGLIGLVKPLRTWDFHAAQKPTFLVTNSTHSQAMIREYYQRDSFVIHPPVDIERFHTASKKSVKRHGFLIVGRQTPYKRIDLAVNACSQLNLPLTVIGNGPEHDKLRSIAGPTITFLTNVDDHEITKYFQQAEAFIFPGIDDFGIVSVESLANGTPVIAYKAGGALDYVVSKKTGVFFDKQSVESLVEALKSFGNQSFNNTEIREFAKQFSQDNFRKNILSFINQNL